MSKAWLWWNQGRNQTDTNAKLLHRGYEPEPMEEYLRRGDCDLFSSGPLELG